MATRLGVHYTHSLEEKQSQPGTEGIENSQIRLSDGSIIFTPDLFGPGITVNEVDYHMTSLDAGVKYKGLSLEGEYYWRWLSNFTGVNTGGIADINDHGYQVQASAMAVPKVAAAVLRRLADLRPARRPVGSAGRRELVLHEGARAAPQRRVDVREQESPVGYTAYPYPVGAKGPVFHINLEMNF